MKIIFLLAFLLQLTLSGSAQVVVEGKTEGEDEDGCKISFTEDGVLLELDRKIAEALQDSILRELGFRSTEAVDSAWNSGNRHYEGMQGWELVKMNQGAYVLQKTMEKFAEGMNKLASKFGVIDDPWLETYAPNNTMYPEAPYGVNNFKRRTVLVLPDGKVRFFLPGNTGSGQVILSGSFNSWNTNKQTMNSTDSGWIADVAIPPGKHLYKFIIDGRWINDEYNNLNEEDGHGGFNSVFFRYNHRFFLPEHYDSKKVFVAGSFNNWKERELLMEKWMGGWVLDLYVREGTHNYKFLADKEWLMDPNNRIARPDGRGNMNNFFSIGEPHVFTLKGFQDAQTVILCGDFNAWNEQEQPMDRTVDGWRLEYVLAAGNYQYKFLVDGKWTLDPFNWHRDGMDPFTNNVVSVESNHRFRLNNYLEAKQVLVSGNFNGWSESGYTLERDESGWYMDVFLKPGKYIYKFVVDGNWILDPDNPHWEENEHGTGNSVLWVELETASSN